MGEAKCPHYSHSVWIGADNRLAATRERESMQQHRHSGVKHCTGILFCTCRRALFNVRRLLLLLCGDVEKNPGPILCGAQWNAGGLSQPKRLSLEKMLDDSRVTFCLLSETHFAEGECINYNINNFQHIGLARTPHGGGVSILVRDGIGLIPWPCKMMGGPESITATLVFSEGVQLTVTSAYFPSRKQVSVPRLDALSKVEGPLVIGADV